MLLRMLYLNNQSKNYKLKKPKLNLYNKLLIWSKAILQKQYMITLPVKKMKFHFQMVLLLQIFYLFQMIGGKAKLPMGQLVYSQVKKKIFFFSIILFEFHLFIIIFLFLANYVEL